MEVTESIKKLLKLLGTQWKDQVLIRVQYSNYQLTRNQPPHIVVALLGVNLYGDDPAVFLAEYSIRDDGNGWTGFAAYLNWYDSLEDPQLIEWLKSVQSTAKDRLKHEHYWFKGSQAVATYLETLKPALHEISGQNPRVLQVLCRVLGELSFGLNHFHEPPKSRVFTSDQFLERVGAEDWERYKRKAYTQMALGTLHRRLHAYISSVNNHDFRQTAVM